MASQRLPDRMNRPVLPVETIGSGSRFVRLSSITLGRLLVALSAIGYMAFRVGWVISIGDMLQVPDSPSYYIANWPNPGRPPIGVLLYWGLGQSVITAIVLALLSSAAFLTLSVAMVRAFPRWPIIAAIPPLYSLCGFVMSWDVVVLSESPSFSGIAFLTAGALGMAAQRSYSAGWFGVATAGAVLAIGTKESTAIFVAAVAISIAVRLIQVRQEPRAMRRHSQSAVSLTLVAAAYLTASASSHQTLTVWLKGEVPEAVQDRVTASNLRSFNIIYSYVIPDPETLTEWTLAGMPAMPKPAANPFLFEYRYQDPSLVQWVNENASELWMKTLAKQPLTALGRVRQVDGKSAASVRVTFVVTDTPAISRSLAVLVPPTAAGQLVLNAGTAAAMVGLLGAFRWKSKRRGPSAKLGVRTSESSPADDTHDPAEARSQTFDGAGHADGSRRDSAGATSTRLADQVDSRQPTWTQKDGDALDATVGRTGAYDQNLSFANACPIGDEETTSNKALPDLGAIAWLCLILSMACALHLVAVVNLDAVEATRHAMPGLVLSPIAFFTAALACLEWLSRHRTSAKRSKLRPNSALR